MSLPVDDMELVIVFRSKGPPEKIVVDPSVTPNLKENVVKVKEITGGEIWVQV